MSILPKLIVVNTLSSLAVVAALFLLAAAVPGPNWIVIARPALASDRRRAVLAALGVALGSTSWMAASMAGAAVTLAHLQRLSMLLRLSGAAYLLWSSALAWRNTMRRTPESDTLEQAGISSRRSFMRGLLTSLTNPRSVFFWTSVFTSALPRHAPALLYFAAGLLVISLAATWYLGIALALSAVGLQSIVGRFQSPLQRAAALVQMALGIRLAVAAIGA